MRVFRVGAIRIQFRGYMQLPGSPLPVQLELSAMGRQKITHCVVVHCFSLQLALMDYAGLG